MSELAEGVDGKVGEKRNAGAIRVLLKKEDVKRLKRRMKNAIRLLSLAYQLRTR